MSSWPVDINKNSIADSALDELEGEALTILDHSKQHAAITVNLARKTLKFIRAVRCGNAPLTRASSVSAVS